MRAIQRRWFQWGTLLFLTVMLIVAVGTWLYLNVQASLQVKSTDAQVELSNSLPTSIDIGQHLQVKAQGDVHAQLNMDHDIHIPLKGRYLTHIQFNTVVPVQVAVDYKTKILIDQILPLSASTDLIYQNKLLPKFPLNVDIPIRLEVPFHLKQIYQLPITFHYSGPVYFELNEQIRLHVLHQFAPRLKLNNAVNLKDISSFHATMFNQERNTLANLEMQLDLPLKNIHP